MRFNITIKHERKNIRLMVKLIEATKGHEKYEVTAKNTSFVLQNNRPVIKTRGLKHFRYTSIMESIIKEIEKKI